MDEQPRRRWFPKTRERLEKFEETHDNFRAVVNHLEIHREAYVAGAGCLVVGYVLRAKSPTISQVAKNTALIQTNPTATNIAVTQIARRGHPGYMIKCVDTGEMYASIRRAAEANAITRHELYRHLKGELPNVGGLVFENLGEMK